MLPVQTKAYKIFNWLLAIADIAIVAVYLVLSSTNLLGPDHLGTSVYTTIIGGSHVAYMLMLYPFLKNRSLVGASLIGTILFTTNLAILLVTTGGFGSPYYALWLILILAIGIYRPSVPLGLLAITTLYFVGEAFSRDLTTSLLSNSVISLLVTYVTGALGFWLWHSHHTKLRAGDSLSELESQLSTEQLKSEIVLRHIGDGVIVVDNQSRVQLLNPAGEKLTGWREAEAKGIDHKLVLPLSSEKDVGPEPEPNPFTQVADSTQAVLKDNVILTPRSGKKMSLSIMVSPIYGDSNRLSGLIGVFRDVSAIKATERQRSEFISTASHEMRTPVAAVEGYIALALNTKVARIDDKARTYLLKAQASTQHLGKLFQDLLATTRIEEGKVPNHPEVVELGSLIKQVIEELKFKADKKQLPLKFQAASRVGGPTKNLQPIYYVYADPERLREVLVNLIDNAIKFTAHGEVVVTLDGNDQQVEIGIRDTGAGIAHQDIPHLFQKFYRIDGSEVRDIGGTGLGLYITRAIVEMYQGRIWVDSQPGKGSRFWLTLPRLAYDKAQTLLAQAAARATVPAPRPATADSPLVASASRGRVE